MENKCWYFYTAKDERSPKILHSVWHGKKPARTKTWKALTKALGSIVNPPNFQIIGYVTSTDALDIQK